MNRAQQHAAEQQGRAPVTAGGHEGDCRPQDQGDGNEELFPVRHSVVSGRYKGSPPDGESELHQLRRLEGKRAEPHPVPVATHAHAHRNRANEDLQVCAAPEGHARPPHPEKARNPRHQKHHRNPEERIAPPFHEDTEKLCPAYRETMSDDDSTNLRPKATMNRMIPSST